MTKILKATVLIETENDNPAEMEKFLRNKLGKDSVVSVNTAYVDWKHCLRNVMEETGW